MSTNVLLGDIPPVQEIGVLRIRDRDGTLMCFIPVRPASIPNNGTKVGDRVRVCWDATHDSGPYCHAMGLQVQHICPFRGVDVGLDIWHRSWVRVKGGAA